MPIDRYFGGHGREVMRDMKRRYGAERGERIFYATANKRGLTARSTRGSEPFAPKELRRGYRRMR